MSLEKLLENPRVWRGSCQASTRAGLASGYPKLDRCLPGGGWPQQALTEILTDQYGIGELRLLMPALAELSTEETHYGEQTEPGWIAWIAPLLWSAEQALSSGTCVAVLLWPDKLDDQGSRRLQLAAEKGHSWAIAFRPLTARQQPSAAALRLELQSTGQGTRVHIIKSRGGRPAVLDSLL
jgi:cell division inhibitor SulA/protein ImuA